MGSLSMQLFLVQDGCSSETTETVAALIASSRFSCALLHIVVTVRCDALLVRSPAVKVTLRKRCQAHCKALGIHHEASIKNLGVEFRGAAWRKGVKARGKRFAGMKARSMRLAALRAAE